MKRSIMKKVGFFAILTLLNIHSVSAFDINNITIDESNIKQPFWADENSTVRIYNDILEENSKVYHSQTILTEKEYSSINVKLDEANNYMDSQKAILKEKKEELTTLKDEVNKLFDEAYKEGASEESKTLYETTKKNYDEKVAAYNKLVDTTNAEFEKKVNEYYKAMPTFNDAWTILEDVTKDGNASEYKVNMNINKANFYISWIKVETAGNTYYSAVLYHDASFDHDEEETNQPTDNAPDEEPDSDVDNTPDASEDNKPGKDEEEDTNNENNVEDTVENPNTGISGKITIAILVLIGMIGFIISKKKTYFGKV